MKQRSFLSLMLRLLAPQSATLYLQTAYDNLIQYKTCLGPDPGTETEAHITKKRRYRAENNTFNGRRRDLPLHCRRYDFEIPQANMGHGLDW